MKSKDQKVWRNYRSEDTITKQQVGEFKELKGKYQKGDEFQRAPLWYQVLILSRVYVCLVV